MAEAIPLMSQNTYKLDKTIRLNNFAHRMCFVNDHIWTVELGNNIKTYDYNLKLIKSMKFNGDLRGITYDKLHEQVITAHCGEEGLHQYDLQGRHICQTCTGNYSDVITHGNKLYALSSSASLHVLTFSGNQWCEHSQVTLCYNHGGYVDRMCIMGDCIYVGSRSNHCIYTFSLQSGQLQHTAGKYGESGPPGELYSPYISGCHGDTGDILVVDCRNHRLQVYNSTQDKWSVVRIHGEELQFPLQALVDQHADNIWVITGQYPSGQLNKYTKSHR